MVHVRKLHRCRVGVAVLLPMDDLRSKHELEVVVTDVLYIIFNDDLYQFAYKQNKECFQKKKRYNV